MQKFCSLFLRDLLFSSGNGKHNRTTTRLPFLLWKKEKVCVCFPTSQSVTPKCTTIVKEGNEKARGKERKNNTSFLLECFTTPHHTVFKNYQKVSFLPATLISKKNLWLYFFDPYKFFWILANSWYLQYKRITKNLKEFWRVEKASPKVSKVTSTCIDESDNFS